MSRLTHWSLLIPVMGVSAIAADACILREDFFTFDDTLVIDTPGTSAGAGQSSSGSGVSCNAPPCGLPEECDDDLDCADAVTCRTFVGCVDKKCAYKNMPNGTVTSTNGCAQIECNNGFEIARNDLPRYTLCEGSKECDGWGKCLPGLGQSCDDNTLCASNICEGGTCRRGLFGKCEQLSDCGSTYGCVRVNSNSGGICKHHHGNKCSGPDDCVNNLCGGSSKLCEKCDPNASPGKPYACLTGYYCASNNTCNSTFVCNKNEDCEAGETCINERCTPNCESNDSDPEFSDCSPDESCLNDFCIRNDALIHPSDVSDPSDP
jgi:hypothetical protein